MNEDQIFTQTGSMVTKKTGMGAESGTFFNQGVFLSVY